LSVIPIQTYSHIFSYMLITINLHNVSEIPTSELLQIVYLI